MQQLLDRLLITLGGTRFELVATRSEPCTPHQVCHQFDVVLICHTRVSSLIRSLSNRPCLRLFDTQGKLMSSPRKPPHASNRGGAGSICSLEPLYAGQCRCQQNSDLNERIFPSAEGRNDVLSKQLHLPH